MGVWVRDTVAVGVDACTSFRVPRRTVSSYAQSVPAVLFRVSGKRRSHTRASTSVWDGTRQGCAVSRLHNYLAPGVPMAASRQRGRHLRYSRTRLVVEHPSLAPAVESCQKKKRKSSLKAVAVALCP